MCLLCKYGLIVGDVDYIECADGLNDPDCFMIEVQNRVNPREWQRFSINAIMPMFSHGDEVSKAYGDALVQLWTEGGQGVDAETQWQRKQGITLLTKVLSTPDELEKSYRAPNDGLVNGASRCWANTLLQLLGLSAKLREKLQASTSLKVVNLLKVLELLQSNEGLLSRVERSKQTNAAAEAFYASMGGIFANKRHNCLDEGYRVLLTMLSEECPDAYDLFVGVMECQSVCQACCAKRLWNQVLTLPMLAASTNQEHKLDFQETLKTSIVASKDTAQNTCESCKLKTLLDVTYVVKVLPSIALVGIHRKYHIKRGAKQIAKKSTSPVVNAKRAFTLSDQFGEVTVVPKAWGVHHGPNATEGHYVAYAAKGHSMATCFNDSKVSQVTLADVDEKLISHVLLEFTRPTEELGKASRKRSRETANLMRAKANFKLLKAPEPSTHEDAVKSQIVGGDENGLMKAAGRSKTADESVKAIVPQGASKDAEADVPQEVNKGAKADVPSGNAKVAERKKAADDGAKASVPGIKASLPEKASKGAKATRKPTREMEGCAHYANDPAIEPGFEADSHSQENLGDMLAVLCWNTRSYRSILTKVRLLPFEVANFDVVVLTETQGDLASLLKHAKFEGSVRKFKFGFWNACLRNNNNKTGYAGVGVLCRRKPSSVQYGFGEEYGDDCDGRLTIVRWKDATLVAVYAPATTLDGTPDRRLFDSKLCALVAKEKARCPVFVVGDINVPLTAQDVSKSQPWLKGKPRAYDEDRKGLLTLMNLNQLKAAGDNGVFTWYPEPTATNQMWQIGMRLDYFIVPEEARVYRYCVLTESTSSDHRPITLEFSLTGMTEPAKHKERRKLYEYTFMTLSSNYSLASQVDLLGEVIARNLQIQSDAREYVNPVNAQFDGPRQPEFRQVSVDPEALERIEADAVLSDLREAEILAVQESISRYYRVDGSAREKVAPPRVEVYLYSSGHHYALMDTGSDLCLVDYLLVSKHMVQFGKEFVGLPGFTLTLGNGETKMKVVGRVRLVVKFKTDEGHYIPVTQWFYCVSALPDCFVIGDAFFIDQRERKADISQFHRWLTMDGVQIPYKEAFPHYHLYLEVECVLAPLTQKEVILTIGRLREEAGVCCLGRVFDRLKAKDLVIIAPTSCLCLNGMIILQIRNNSQSEQRVVKNQNMACFQASEPLREATVGERQCR